MAHLVARSNGTALNFQLLAQHRHIARRLDAEPHLVTLLPQNFHDDVVADQQVLARPPS